MDKINFLNNKLDNKENWGWSIPDILLERTDLDMYEKVLIAIMGRLGALEKPVYPRQKWLAEKMGMSESGIRKTLKRLQEKKIIKYEGKNWKIAMYSLTVPSGRSSPSRQDGDSPTRQDGDKKDIQSKDIQIKTNNKTNIQKIVDYFFELKGWDYKENKIVYNSYTKPAKQLLEICKSNLEIAKSKLKEIKDWAESRGLDWSLSTAVKRFKENNSPKQKITKEYYMGNPIFQKFGKEYVMGSDGIERVFDRRMANPKDIEVKEI